MYSLAFVWCCFDMMLGGVCVLFVFVCVCCGCCLFDVVVDFAVGCVCFVFVVRLLLRLIDRRCFRRGARCLFVFVCAIVFDAVCSMLVLICFWIMFMLQFA